MVRRSDLHGLTRRSTAALLLAFLAAGVAGAEAGPPDVRRLHLQTASFDPLAGPPAMPLPEIRGHPSGTRGGYLVQLDHAITGSDRLALEAAGASVHGYVPMRALELVMTEETRERIERLDGVRFVGPLQPGLKLGPRLAGMLGAPDAGRRLRVQLSLFRGEEGTTAAELARAGVRVLRLEVGRAQSVATVELPAARLEALVRHPLVRRAELAPELKPHNDRARHHAGLDDVADATFTAGLDPSLDGSDEGSGFQLKFGHFDTGIDTSHPDFQTPTLTLEAGADGSDADDGHGTHTAGSLVGDGSAWASVPQLPPGSDAVSAASWRGVAPEAALHHISFENDYTDRQIFERQSEEGVHVSSNSWGYCTPRGPFRCDSITDYNINAALWDEGVWDADDDVPGQQPLIVFFSAGNDGDGDSSGCGTTGSDQVGSPGTAKNVITVAANETDRGCNAFADHVGDVIDFSSRGPVDPAPSGRGLFKPDLTHIGGDFVLSAEAAGAGGSGRDAPPVCSDTGPSYRYEGGTSMSTPLAAGLGGIVVQDLVVHRGVTQPAPSLVKALLVNGASRLEPSGSCDYTLDVTASTVHQGWGLVRAPESLYGPGGSPGARSVDFENETDAVATGETHPRSIVVPAGVPLVVTLAWTDYPATAGAGSPLVVNDLDLEVVGPEGTFLGNHFSEQGWSEISAQASPDRYNVVENVRIQAVAGGSYELRVGGVQVSQDQEPATPGVDQDFSLVWSFPRLAQCADGVDNDGDGLVDRSGGDPGCADADDDDERSLALVCDDGLDNDDDGWTDLADPGCRDGSFPREDSRCQNGEDDDGDGRVDFDGGVSIHGEGAPELTDPDPQCANPWRNSEAPAPRCGLGFEILLLLAPLAFRRRGTQVPTRA